MVKPLLFLTALFASTALHAQCQLSLGGLELFIQSNVQAIDNYAEEKGFSLAKDHQQGDVLQKHYFCKTYANRSDASQLTAIIFENITKAVSFETVDSLSLNGILTDMSKSGYHFTHLDESPVGDQLTKMMHYRKGNTEAVTYSYVMDGYRIYCCTLGLK